MAVVVTQLVVDASGAKLGVAEFTAAMDKAKRAAVDTGDATASSFERAQSRWTASLAKTDPVIKAQIAMEKDLARQRQINADAVKLNISTQDAANAQLEKVRAQHQAYIATLGNTTAATQKFAGQTGLARHELINLSRQAQDVGVSLASGQSPLTVLVQQGTQIADVFASGGGTVRGFFSQAIGWAGRFALSTTGVVTGIAAIATGAVALAASWSSAQREIDKTLATPAGAASGVSRGGINSLAERGSSSFGLSVSEAREAATAFAATGKIYEENILRATQITKQFGQALGLDAGEAAKKLAQDLTTPGASAAEWAKKIQGIDADTVNYIRTLENMGNRQGAINALIDVAIPGLAKQAEHVGLLTKAWDFYANRVSNNFDAIKQGAARVGDNITGGNTFGSRSDEEQLGRLQGRQSDLQGSRVPKMDAAELKAVTAAITELEQKMADLRKQTEDQRFANLSNEIDGFARSVNATEKQIEQLSAALLKLEQYQAQRQDRGLVADPGADQATQKIQDQIAALIEADHAEKNRSRSVAETVMRYKDVSTATALALASLEGQLTVAQQLTGAGQMQAQAQASFNSLLAQGKTEYEAMTLASAQLAVNQESASTSIQKQTEALKDQTKVMRASEGRDRARTIAAIAFKDAINDGADEQSAAALKAATFANEMEKAAQAAKRVSDSVSKAGFDMQSAKWDWSEADAYDAAGGHRPDTVASGAFSGLGGPTEMKGGTFAQGPEALFSRAGVFFAGALSMADFAKVAMQAFDPHRQQRMESFALGQSSQAQFLSGGSKNDKIAGLQMQMQGLYPTLGEHPENIWQIRSLERSIQELMSAVDDNTDALNKVTLNPLYTEGRSALKLGYMHAARGLDFIAQGPSYGDQIPLHLKVNGGERVQVTPAGQTANDNSRTTVVTNNIVISGSQSTKRRSATQLAQRYGQVMAALS